MEFFIAWVGTYFVMGTLVLSAFFTIKKYWNGEPLDFLSNLKASYIGVALSPFILYNICTGKRELNIGITMVTDSNSDTDESDNENEDKNE